jgi:hypothetical protein
MAGKAVLKALRHVWLTLDPAHCTIALMGGLAVSAWKHVRNTQDVDLLIHLGDIGVDSLIELLQRAGVRAKHRPPIIDLGSVRIIQLLYEPPDVFLDIQIDLLLAESEYHQRAITRRVAAQIDDLDIDINILSCEDLLIHKLIAGRIIDRADAASLLRLHRSSLDFAYLSQWVSQLALGSEWAEIWHEAFPGLQQPLEFAHQKESSHDE